jgi:hypothetical protein
MELADWRRQAEAQVTQARQLLGNPQLLRQYLADLERQAPPTHTPPQAPDADDLLTASQTQQLLQAQLAAVQRQSEQYVQQAILKAETARYTEEYTTEVNRTMTSLKEKFPVLSDVDKVEKLILDDVSEQIKARIAMEPDQVVEIGEVKTLMAQAAQKRADKLQARVKEHQKMELVRQAKAKQQGIEPPGGTPPPAKPAQNFKLGDPRLVELAIADLQASMKK